MFAFYFFGAFILNLSAFITSAMSVMQGHALILTLIMTENFPIPLSMLYHIPVERTEDGEWLGQ